jgi:hypothetical protein
MLPNEARLAGIGGYAAKRTNTGFLIARSGYVVFNAGHIFTMSPRRQYVVALHELGHVVGLADVTDTRQVMNSEILVRGPSHYATGDLWGLHRVGRRAGCLVPAPAPKPPTAVRSGNRVSVTTAPVVSVSGPVTYTLSSPELGQLSRSTTPAFSVSLDTIADRGYAGKVIHFKVRAANRVGASSSSLVGYAVPAAVLTRVPSLVATPTSLDVVAPRAVLSGTTVDVSDHLRITTAGTVGVYKERGLAYSVALYEHLLVFGLPVWSYQVAGSVKVEGAGVQRTFDVSGNYRTSAWQPPPDPTPSPTP